MVILEDIIYADLESRASKADALEAENARLKAELEAHTARLAADAEQQKVEAAACAVPEPYEEQERRFAVLKLQAEVQHLREKLALSIRRKFGATSERRITGQEAFLFNEVEAEAKPGGRDPVTQVAAHVRRTKKPGQRELQLGGLEVREEIYDLPEEERNCPVCSEPMRKMGENERIKVEITPIVVTVVREKQAKYCCCNPNDHPMNTPIVKAPLPPTAFPKSLATPSTVAHIMYEKYVMGSPLYRQEQDLARLGFPISRQTMANWVIAGALLMDRIYIRLRVYLLKQDILHGDETPIQVLLEVGRAATTKSYMWLYRTGRYSHRVVLFDYQPTRGREHPTQFLTGFVGYLHVDGYAGYEKLLNIILSGCWAHARRGFVEAIDTLSSDKREEGGTLAHEGLAFCNHLFKIERELHDVTPEERRIGRQQRSLPVVEEFRKWLDATALTVLPKFPLGGAVRYCIRQWGKLIVFLEDGRLELDNNRAERSIKPFVIGRNNWLFANTPEGADASATIYSIVETANENDLDPRKYLQFLFEQLPLLHKATEKQLDALLPWEAAAQAACRIPKSITP